MVMRRTTSTHPFYRWLILIVLAYEAAGCLLGGALLLLAPDGHLMAMPPSIMHGSFADFTIPGIILFMLGILSAAAFWSVLRKVGLYMLVALIALGALLGWFWIEIAILRQVHWLHAMWGLPVVMAGGAALSIYPWTASTKRGTMLICGIAASLLYLDIMIVVPLLWKTYHSTSQTISELAAVGAPTRFIWTTLSLPYNLLMVAFACGVLLSAGRRRSLKTAGYLLLVYALTGLAWPFVPMHQRLTLAMGGATISDQLHLILGGLTEILFLSALLFASSGLGLIFRIYSLLTLALVLLFGMLTFSDINHLAANHRTPYLGIWERANIVTFLIWVTILAFELIKNGQRKSI